MFERRMSVLVAALVVFLGSAALWNAFVRPAPRSSPSAMSDVALGTPPSEPSDSARDNSTPAAPAAPAPRAARAPPIDASGPTYIVLLARSEIRRRIRASAGLTYLNEIVAATPDSVLHRWDGRVARPVGVFLPTGSVANFQPAFLDAVRNAFGRWQEAGVPVRFNLDADSAPAEVRFQWRMQFEGERAGQTDLEWDQADGHLIGGVVTLATSDPKGQPLGSDDMRVLALHEIGHLIGLDHCPDSSDLMFAQTKVRDLSPRDIATALLLYELPAGPVRAGR